MALQPNNAFHLLLLFIFPVFVNAQSGTVSGIVVDSANQMPIAFAGVTVKETKRGVLTDIDGRFVLQNVPANSHLQISYTGYALQQITLTKNNTPLHIAITRKNDPLEDVVVRSDLNPAHRIILLMQQNRKHNDPLLLPSYFYNAYTIAALGTGPHLWNMGREMRELYDAKNTRKPRPEKAAGKPMSHSDSVMMIAMKAASAELRQNYMFVTESYTERKYQYFRKAKETVLATKVSGIKNPLFAVTNADFQTFGFYLDYMFLGNKTYTSPVISGSINLYKFNLREVIVHEKDTTWVISYEPKKGKNFNGLKGLLYINSDHYAIENVTASPADEKDMIMSFRLQQKYEKVNGQWFPKQLNAYLAQKDITKDSVLFYWDTRTYLTNIEINKPFLPSEFSDVALEVPRDAGKRTEEQWQQYRTDSLQTKEKATYKAYESMPPKMLNMFNAINNFTEAAALQAIPWGKIDIPFKYLIGGANSYEQFRLGAGFQTNTLFSKWLSVGGYTGYGFGDHAWKYGGNLAFTFNRRTHTELQFSYKQDLQEPGTISFFRDNATLYSNNTLRSLYASRMDSIRQYKVQFSTKLTPNLQATAWLSQEQRNPAGYEYGFDIDGKNQFIHQYNNTEAGIGIRYTRRETYARFGRALVMNTPPRTQILFQLSKGLKGPLDGQLDYTKLGLQINQYFNTKWFGRTSFQAELGKVWGNIPYAYMFNTRGVAQQQGRRRGSGLFVGNSFQTAGIYEFSSTQSASLFLQQNFGSLLFKPANAKFRPEFVLVQNIGYGSISNPLSHTGQTLQAPEKGLFESGVLINNLYRINLKFLYLGFGIGYFQRYGYYTLPEKAKNRALKFGFSFSF